MDKRTLLAVLISISIYYVWMVIKGPPPNLEELPVDTLEPVEAEPEPAPVAQPRPKTDVEVQTLDLEFCGTVSTWSNDGGVVRSMHLDYEMAPFDVTPFYMYVYGLVTGAGTNWNPYGDDPGPQQILSDDSLALAVGTGVGPDYRNVRMEVLDKGPDRVTARGVTDEGIEIHYQLGPRKGESADDPCQAQLDVTWKNTGGAYEGELWVANHDVVPEISGMMSMYQSNKQVTAYVGGDVEYGTYDEEDPEALVLDVEGETTWMSVGDRYYAMRVLPEDATGKFAFTSRNIDAETWLQGMTYTVAPGLEAGAEKTASFRIFVGSSDTDRMGLVHEDLPEAVDLGWFAFFGKPLLYLLKLFHSFVGDWGVAIILLTLTMKLLLFPLTQTAFKSSQAMQGIQPQMKEINEKFADNPEEKQKAIMELFKANNVNPLGGCLPMVIQMPIWFALYRVLLSSVELYHTEFLYLKDLSSPDPYGVLPAIVVVLMLVQQQFTPMGNMDPAQARMMKLMPLAFGAFFFTFPSGLVVYIFVNMLLSILQQWFIRRTFKAPEGPASATPAPAA